MITNYLSAALRKAQVERLEDGTFYGEISGFPGLWPSGTTDAEARRELEEVLEEWVLFRIWQHLDLPIVDGITLLVREAS